MTEPSAFPVCPCDCGCEPDGEWHFEGTGCSCVALGCDCVIDAPGQPACICPELYRMFPMTPSHEENCPLFKPEPWEGAVYYIAPSWSAIPRKWSEE